MNAQVRKVSSRKMHDIVWILVGLFGLFAITFPLAMWRVSNMEKFQGSHVKSLVQLVTGNVIAESISAFDLKELSAKGAELK